MDITKQRKCMEQYMLQLVLEEKSSATQQQYRRDVRQFLGWLEKKDGLERKEVLLYKEHLQTVYKVSTVNTKLAALNHFFTFLEREDLKVKQLKVQRKIFCSKDSELTREEYERLVEAAKKQEDERLALLIETICSTGIRVSELPFITVEAVREGEAALYLKGKNRPLMLPGRLRKLLKSYIRRHKLKKGSVFVTRTGKPLNRSHIWRMMKDLSGRAGVAPEKVFPHNLRHLFARCFYAVSKDIVKLADILGHSNINTTRIYVISSGEEHQRQLDLMRLVV